MLFLRTMQHHSQLKQGCVASIGNFDGVHLGHQALLKELRAEATRLKVPLLVVVFEPQAREFFAPESAPKRLSTLREKMHAFRAAGVDMVYCLRFNQSLANQSAVDFAKDILFKRLNIQYLLIGQDFRFGREREGDVSLLQQIASEMGRQVEVYPDVIQQEARISSTRIRKALQEGALQQAAQCLGQPYSMCGRVVHGDARARLWGVPTANLRVHHQSFPLHGVYCVNVQRQDGSMQSGVANVGRRPTLDGKTSLVEIHLLDVNESLYGERLQVFFLHKLRDEVKFPSLDALIAGIKADVSSARAFFKGKVPI